MEKLFNDFLKKRQKNEDFRRATGDSDPDRDRDHNAEKESFLDEVKKLDPTKYNLSSFLKDLTSRSDLEVFPSEKDVFRKALIDKETVDELEKQAEQNDVPFDLVRNIILSVYHDKNYSNQKIMKDGLYRLLNQQWLHHEILKEIDDENK